MNTVNKEVMDQINQLVDSEDRDDVVQALLGASTAVSLNSSNPWHNALAKQHENTAGTCNKNSN